MTEQKMIRIMCPDIGCQRILTVPAHARGKLVRCRSCGMTVRIPASGGAGDQATEEAASS